MKERQGESGGESNEGKICGNRKEGRKDKRKEDLRVRKDESKKDLGKGEL
jgi:hypothetical protein